MSVLLVDDQAMIRSGLRTLLEASGVTVVGEASNGRQAYTMASALHPDVVLMDVRMPTLDGTEATRLIRNDPALEAVRVLVLTTFDDEPDVLRAVRAGADGFLSKSAGTQELVSALRSVSHGQPSLSDSALRALMRNVSPAADTTQVDPDLARKTEQLTPREREVVARLASGDDLPALAARLHISPHTAKTHLNRAMAKLDARDRGQLVALAYQTGIASR
ncbi:response regulator transcription factor [Leifsonia xyli]|uniref:response regulator transcription factor n=1 Tax=Leifsonia xyli TaxID=1575 RepID=UPI003D6796BB